MAIVSPFGLVIVDQVDVIHVVTNESKDDPPIAGNPDASIPLTVAPELMQPTTRHRHVMR